MIIDTYGVVRFGMVIAQDVMLGVHSPGGLN